MDYTEAPKLWWPVIQFAREHACPWSLDPVTDPHNWGIHLNDAPPHNRLLGPVFARGPVSGLIDLNGKIVCEWGEPARADMTFSVTKTYLALVAGIAYDQGLLPDPDEPVHRRVPGLGFDDAHNKQITWAQMLQFTSEWQGVCFGIPDQIDHHRRAGLQPAQADLPPKGTKRPLQAPGSFWEYNDVRINQFSLALMHLMQRPLPEVFDEAVMTPIGASDRWQWHGYDNSWVQVNGKRMQSVPGGGHWGGGMQISAHDQRLVARMMLDRGHFNGQQIISRAWIDRMTQPCAIAPFYGFFTWLNRGHRPVPTASPESFFGLGVGGQAIWHDPTQNLVAVFRWIDTPFLPDLIALINQAVTQINQNK